MESAITTSICCRGKQTSPTQTIPNRVKPRSHLWMAAAATVETCGGVSIIKTHLAKKSLAFGV